LRAEVVLHQKDKGALTIFSIMNQVRDLEQPRFTARCFTRCQPCVCVKHSSRASPYPDLHVFAPSSTSPRRMSTDLSSPCAISKRNGRLRSELKKSSDISLNTRECISAPVSVLSAIIQFIER
jgi:hypothetical protein